MPPKNKKTARLSCRVDSGLMTWARWYVRRKHTTLTQLITDHLQELRERTQSLDDDVEQV